LICIFFIAVFAASYKLFVIYYNRFDIIPFLLSNYPFDSWEDKAAAQLFSIFVLLTKPLHMKLFRQLLWSSIIVLVFLSCHKGTSKELTGKIAQHNGKPTLMINDKPYIPIIYALTSCPGGRFSFDEVPQFSIKCFADQGVKLFQVELWLRDIFDEKGNLNIQLVQKQIRGILDKCPDAAVFIRLRLNATTEWNRAHPDECVRFADTVAIDNEQWGLHRWDDHDTENSLRASLASKLWQDDVVNKLRTFCSQVAKTPEGNSLIGVQVATGIYGENHYWGFIKNDPDTSLAMKHYFRSWLKDKYKTEAILQKAWNNNSINFENANVPNQKERLFNSDGIFRDPQKERKTIDYYEAQHQCVADNLILFARTVKESWPRNIITGCFYGYFFNVFGRHAVGGHLQMERILNSPYIDYLSGPMSYNSFCREMGGSGQSRGIIDAVRLHGKLWLDEQDENTYLHASGSNEYRNFKTTLPEDIAYIRRALAEAYTRGAGEWFYDFGPNTVTSWWNDTTLLRTIKELKNVFEKYSQKPFTHDADVLFVYDTDVYYYLAHDWLIDIISHTGVEWASNDAYHSGTIFDECHLSDLKKMDWKKYKAVVFVNTFKLSAEQKIYIKNTVAKDKRTIVWNYMPGYTDGNTLNDQFVKDLVGMTIEKIKLNAKPPMVVMNGNESVNYTVWNSNPPVFAIKDSKVVPLAHFKENNLTAIAKKDMGEWTSVFCSLPLQKSEMMRKIFKEAGCHIFSNDGDVIFSGGGIFAVHTKVGGKRHFTLLNGKTIDTVLQSKSTCLFDNNTGQTLIR
jgi:hypothetical protein